MTRKPKLLKVILGIMLACCALAVTREVFMSSAANPKSPSFPLDQDLFATFRDRRAEFDKLHQMVTEDSRIESYFSDSHLDAKLGDVRRQEYGHLLAEIHRGLVVTVDYDKTVRFIFVSGGLSAISSGWLKGIEYVPGSFEKKGVILQNLDGANTLSAGVYLRQIEPNWFIVYQRTDD